MRVLFSALSLFLFLMSVGAGGPSAHPADALTTRHMPMMHTLPAPGGQAQGQAQASGMHALNAPVRAGNNAGGGRVVQSEKRVLIHSGPLPSVNSLTQ